MKKIDREDYLVVLITVLLVIVGAYGSVFLIVKYQQEFMIEILLAESGVIGMFWYMYRQINHKEEYSDGDFDSVR